MRQAEPRRFGHRQVARQVLFHFLRNNLLAAAADYCLQTAG
jgi:hypothetical protein